MDLWRIQSLICILPAIAFFVLNNGRHLLIPKIAWTYFLCSAAFVAFSVDPIYGQLHYRIAHTAAISLITIFFVPAGIIAANVTQLRWLGVFFDALMIVNAVLILVYGYGVFGASSFDASICTMLLPWFALSRPLHWINIAISLFVLGVILSTGATTPIVMLVAMGSVMLWQRGHWKWLIPLPLLLAGLAYYGSSSGRVGAWGSLFEWWRDNANPVIGTGLGTFEWLGPYIQMSNGQTQEFFLWMHNDYLQVLFEGGLVGLGLFLAVCVLCAWRAREKKIVLPCLAAIGVCMLSQFPLHWFLSSLWIAFMARLSLEDR